ASLEDVCFELDLVNCSQFHWYWRPGDAVSVPTVLVSRDLANDIELGQPDGPCCGSPGLCGHSAADYCCHCGRFPHGTRAHHSPLFSYHHFCGNVVFQCAVCLHGCIDRTWHGWNLGLGPFRVSP